jgi:FlaG/FlaF family flagellin (archaellin)
MLDKSKLERIKQRIKQRKQRKGLTQIVGLILILAIVVTFGALLFNAVYGLDLFSSGNADVAVTYDDQTNKYQLIRNDDNLTVGVGVDTSTDPNSIDTEFSGVGSTVTASGPVVAEVDGSLQVIRDDS